MNLVLLLALGLPAAPQEDPAPRPEERPSAGGWFAWRGPTGTGHAPAAGPPTTWSEGENLRWKVAIPGRGISSPIVFADRVFLTSAIRGEELEGEDAPDPQSGDGGRRRGGATLPAHEYAFAVLCLRLADGGVVWRTTVREAVPHAGTHSDGSYASASPTTDGRRLYVSFGSQGVYALSLDGEVLWERDLGRMQTRRSFGEGSSPVVHGDRLIVNWDHEEQSFLTALDAATGEEVWRALRDEPTTWSTPLVVDVGDTAQVVTNGRSVRGYDAATGELLWSVPGMTDNAIPTPIHRDGVVYAMTGFRGYALKAIELGEREAETSVAWSLDHDTSYVPSGLLHEGLLYFLKSNTGMLSVADAKTGEVVHGPTRLPVANVYASPVASQSHVFVVGRDGETAVLRPGPEPEVVAVNTLDEGFDASPALVGGAMLLRGREHLYCIGE